MYQINRDPDTNEIVSITRWLNDAKDSSMGIPPDPLNSDYAAYLKWVAQSNAADDPQGEEKADNR